LFSSLAVAGEGSVLQVQLSKFDAMQSLLCRAPAVLTSERHQRTVPEREPRRWLLNLRKQHIVPHRMASEKSLVRCSAVHLSTAHHSGFLVQQIEGNLVGDENCR
jgi:hypothetical protein